MSCPFVFVISRARRFQSKAYFRPFLLSVGWLDSFFLLIININKQHHHRHHINMDTSAALMHSYCQCSTYGPRTHLGGRFCTNRRAVDDVHPKCTCTLHRERIHFTLTPCDAPGRTSSSSGYWAVRVVQPLCELRNRPCRRERAACTLTCTIHCARQLLAATSHQQPPVHKYREPASEIATYI